MHRTKNTSKERTSKYLVGKKASLKKLLCIIILTLSLVGCLKEKTQSISINGTWESIGSGWILNIKDSTDYSLYDVTAVSCLPNRKASISEIMEELSLKNDTLSLKKGVITYKFTKIAALPEICSAVQTEDEKNDPLYNFEVFADNVKEHYAFMELNNINWDSLYTAQKEKLIVKPTEVNLYKILEETLEKLNDNHAYLEASDTLYAQLEAEEEEVVVVEEETETETEIREYGDLEVAIMVADNHLQEVMTRDSKLIRWGKLTDNIGYVQIMAMWLHADLQIPKELIEKKGYLDAYVETFHKMYEGDYIKKEVDAVKKIMDNVMADLSAMESIVMDVRFNGGGQDAVSFEILSRFIEDSLHIANQRLKYGNALSPTLPLYIEGTQEAYNKPVYVLTSPQTGSAAEAFSIATMVMPKVKRIGSATTGAMSTALEKTLPNGWSFSISNEIYMDTEGNIYENKGIPVDHELGYSRERQTFFRSVALDLEKDKIDILNALEATQTD
nr:S41 family peptidase [Allomuricauda sp.]